MNTTATKPYRVRGVDIDHDGKRYPEGELIELDDATAQSLRRWLDPEEPAASAKPKAEPKKPGGDGGQKDGGGQDNPV